MYTLKAAEELKVTLLRKQKAIDDISQKLLLGDGEQGPKEMLLRRNIRIMAQQTLQVGYSCIIRDLASELARQFDRSTIQRTIRHSGGKA